MKGLLNTYKGKIQFIIWHTDFAEILLFSINLHTFSFTAHAVCVILFSLQKNVRICLPVPLYHCFGSVGGGMVMAVHGTTVIFPSTGYDGHANLVAIEKEKYVFMFHVFVYFKTRIDVL